MGCPPLPRGAGFADAERESAPDPERHSTAASNQRPFDEVIHRPGGIEAIARGTKRADAPPRRSGRAEANGEPHFAGPPKSHSNDLGGSRSGRKEGRPYPCPS